MKVNKIVNILGFFMLAYYIFVIPNNIDLMLGLIFGILMILIINKGKIIVNNFFWIILCFSFTFFSLESFLKYSIIHRLTYGSTIVVMFLIGYNWLYNKSYDDSNQIIINVVRATSVLMTTYIFLCFLYTCRVDGISSMAITREVVTIFDGSRIVSTHFGVLSSLPLAIAILGILIEKKKWRIINCIIIAIIAICNIFMSNRVIFLFLVLFALLAAFLKLRTTSRQSKTNIIVAILVALGILVIIYYFNLFDIKTIISELPVVERMLDLRESGYNEPRIERQIYIMMNFTKYMWGGGHFNYEIGEPHNVWLDIYDYAGIIPFMFFVFITIYLLNKLRKSLSMVSCKARLYMFMIIITFFITFMEEPVIRSTESFMALFFLFCGLFVSYMRKTDVKQSATFN